MKQIRLSPSRLALFRECKRCFWLNVNKGLKRPRGIFASLPNGMDLVLKGNFDKFRKESTLPPDIQGKLKGHLFDDMEKLSVWRNNFKGLQYVDKKTGIILMGALDDLFVTENGEHVPLDFKTRGFPLKEDTAEHYQNQMDVYCFLLEKNGMKTGDFACLIFYYPTGAEGNGNFEFGVDVVKMKTDKKRGEKLFMDAVEILQGPEPKANNECPWCNWGSHNNFKSDIENSGVKNG